MRSSAFFSVLILSVAMAAACGGEDRDPAPSDAGLPDGTLLDGDTADGSGIDAGECSEFDPTACPRMYTMAPIPLNEFCATFTNLFCRANLRCCENAAERYPSVAQCEVQQRSRCLDEIDGVVFMDAIAAGDIRYSQAGAGAALERIGPQVDACEPVDIVSEMFATLDGTIASGGACTPLGCEAGLACVASAPGAGSMTCGAEPMAGSSCDANMRCGRQTDLWCDSGTCATLAATGESCTADELCASGTCAGGTCGPFDTAAAYCARQGLVSARPFRR